jgi:hypothetical protein
VTQTDAPRRASTFSTSCDRMVGMMGAATTPRRNARPCAHIHDTSSVWSRPLRHGARSPRSRQGSHRASAAGPAAGSSRQTPSARNRATSDSGGRRLNAASPGPLTNGSAVVVIGTTLGPIAADILTQSCL